MFTKFTRVTALIVLCVLLGKLRVLAQSPSDLFISEYVEGSSNNKAIELYNGTGAAINLNAGNYVVQMYFNGATTATTIALTGTVPANGTFVFAHGDATFITQNVGSVTANQVSANGASWYNGDDAIILRKGGASGTVLDVIGQLGNDPGSEWGTGLTSTADNTLRRKAGICQGDANAADAFNPATEWDGFAQNTFDGLGSHTTLCSVTGSGISLAPSSLQFTTPVGIPAAQQVYTVKGTDLTTDINITIPPLSGFALSLTNGGPYSGTITVPASTANAVPVNVYVIFTTATAGTQTGNITHVSGSQSANLAVTGSAVTQNGTTPVYAIQGTGTASPELGNSVTTEGIVTADFQAAGQLNGFFIQDPTGDGNPATSDGIFVYNTSFAVNVGDHVRLTGTVDEFFNKTEIKDLTALQIITPGHALPAPVVVTLPAATNDELERYEGMLVTFSQVLTASEVFTLGRFGEVVLSAGRLFQPTAFVDLNDNPASGTSSNGTSNVAAVTAQQNLNNRSRIVLDDASTVENPAAVPYVDPVDKTLRLGSTVSNLTGVMDYDFSVYRLQPTVAPVFNYAPRPAVPNVGNANVKVASFNVLNYFNGNGSGGGFPTSRGATNLNEFNRQRTKIIAAIDSLDADVVGLIEIENDGSGSLSAIADLVNGLNAVTAPGTYALIADPTGANGNAGTDEIKQAIIYKPGVVTPVGLARADMNSVYSRPPIAQTFSLKSNNEKFTMIVNHFKSKGCGSSSGANTDQGDGQSCYNLSRKQQAAALISFISTLQQASGDSDIVTVGDYNAYEEEDPIDILRAGGLKDPAAGIYSYVFQGQTGSLDYAWVTPSLFTQVSGANKWHINSDEPIAKDYNTEYYPANMYSPDPFRSSDHDPVLVGLRLGTVSSSPSVSITTPTTGAEFAAGNGLITVTATATDADGSVTKVEFFANGVKVAEDNTAPYSLSATGIEAGVYKVTAKATDNLGNTKVSDTVVINVIACTSTGYANAEGYIGIPGSSISNLTSHPSYPNNPAIVAQLTSLEIQNAGDSYGDRIRGYICAPVTGAYQFGISGNEQAELWLSTNDQPATKQKIAWIYTAVPFRSYLTYPGQASAAITLVKGGRYYFEILHKENTGDDHVSVAWRLPNGNIEAPIGGNRLSPFVTAPAVVAGNFAAAMQEKQTGAAQGLTVQALPNPFLGQFTLITRSNNSETLLVTITDMLGRVVERHAGVAANGTLRTGESLSAGVYVVEVKQGTQKQQLKLVKQ